mgnify:CR=1 FL=1
MPGATATFYILQKCCKSLPDYSTSMASLCKVHKSACVKRWPEKFSGANRVPEIIQGTAFVGEIKQMQNAM